MGVKVIAVSGVRQTGEQPEDIVEVKVIAVSGVRWVSSWKIWSGGEGHCGVRELDG